MKILVVDDSRLARASLIKTLNTEFEGDNEIIQGSNGEEALSLYKEESPEIVFLDLTMPIMDGFEALKAIKAFDEKALIVIVSADVQTKAVAQVMKDGAVIHIQKPINSDKMKEVIKTLRFLNKVNSHHE